MDCYELNWVPLGVIVAFEPSLVIVQLPSGVRLFSTLFDPFATLQIAALQASLSFTISKTLLKLMSIELAMPSSHLILLPPSPPAFNLSQHQGIFQQVGSLHHVAKVLELQF